MQGDRGLWRAQANRDSSLWSALASAARHCFGCVLRQVNPRRRRRFAQPAHSKKVDRLVLLDFEGNVFEMARNWTLLMRANARYRLNEGGNK